MIHLGMDVSVMNSGSLSPWAERGYSPVTVGTVFHSLASVDSLHTQPLLLLAAPHSASGNSVHAAQINVSLCVLLKGCN